VARSRHASPRSGTKDAELAQLRTGSGKSGRVAVKMKSKKSMCTMFLEKSEKPKSAASYISSKGSE